MTEASNDKRDFFVSFNQADRAWATWIAWILEANGYSVFFQDWDFRGSFVEQIHQANLRAGRTLVVLSDNYLRSEYARSEAWVVLAGDPVGREDRAVTVKVGPTGDLGLFSHFAYLDLTDSTEADAERLLLERARKSLDLTYRPKPTTRPRFPGPSAAKPPFPAPAVGPTLAVHNLPPHNPDFIGREGPLKELRRLLTGGPSAAVQIQAITGLGGIGKTQTALAYCYRYLADYTLVWWLRTESAEVLAADFTTLAVPLGLDPAAADQAELIASIRAALQASESWLLVFDNVEDPKLPRSYLPSTGRGHALITSRRIDWQGLARALPLEVMEEGEALHLLTGHPDPDALPMLELAEAKALAKELGHLPLALAQARAYMQESVETFAGYRALLGTSPAKLLENGRAQADYPKPVARTWDISIRAAEQQCPEARPLLELLAFLAHAALPRQVLDDGTAELPESLRDKFVRNRAIGALNKFSLIRAEGGSITVHRLVQAVTRDGLDEVTAKNRAEVAGRLVKAVLILGRFTPERKAVLDALREMLRQRNLLPIVFDFDVPAGRDVTEMVKVLAGSARFVVADVTDATEVRAELHHIVPGFSSLPVQPILLRGRGEFVSLAGHLAMYPWVLPTFEYEDLDHLLANLDQGVIAPAEAKVEALRERGRAIEVELTRPAG